MNDLSIFDIILSVKKRLHILIAMIFIGAAAGYFAAGYFQSYTASVNLEYKNSGSDKGLAPNGGALDPYEIMTPSLISTALANMGEYNLTVENIRNKLSVTEVVDTTTQEIIKAATEKGQAYEYYANKYLITFGYDGKYGAEFGKYVLYNILGAYDDYFIQKYYNKIKIVNFLDNIDSSSVDYMELCTLIENNFAQTKKDLLYLEKADENFRSSRTGLTFSDLINLYDGLQNIAYQKYYSNVREGHLTKDLGTLVAVYTDKIESTKLLMAISQEESGLSLEKVQKYYEQYKNAVGTGTVGDGKSSDNGVGSDIVYDIDFSALINTYDDILTKYVNSGVTAADYEYDIDFYQTIIKDFTSDSAETPEKQALLSENERIYADMYSSLAEYVKLSNEVIDEYYNKKAVSDINYTTSIGVAQNISTSVVAAAGAAISAAAACILFVFIDIFKKASEKHKIEAVLKDKDNDNKAVTPQVLSKMTAFEFALYMQYKNGFTEFYLVLQPIVSGGEWGVAEALLRWDSEKAAGVSPNEIVRIAQKYGFMDELELLIMRCACLQLKEWEKAGIKDVKISVNYTVAQIEKPSFVDSLWRAVSETGADPGDIYFEISGGGDFSNLDYIKQKLATLKKTGVKIAVDRFGESFTSMKALYELPIDMVKISRDYIAGVADGNISRFVIDTVRICRELGIAVCMLGVENYEEYRKLSEIGVDYMQGYYFSMPMKAKDYTKQIKQMKLSERSGAAKVRRKYGAENSVTGSGGEGGENSEDGNNAGQSGQNG